MALNMYQFRPYANPNVSLCACASLYIKIDRDYNYFPFILNYESALSAICIDHVKDYQPLRLCLISSLKRGVTRSIKEHFRK